MLKKLFSYKVPRNLLITVNFLGLLLVILYNKTFDKYSLGIAISLIALIYLSNYFLNKVSTGDNYIFLIVSMMMSIGIIMIYRINPILGFKQVIWFGLGTLILFVSYFIVKLINNKWSRLMRAYVILSVILFLFTLIFGSTIKGATNWIKIGQYTFQPAELIKLVFIFFLASYYVNRDKFENKYFVISIAYMNIGFLFIQKDLGTALLFYLIFVTIFYVYERDRRFILYNLLGSMIIGIIAYFVFSHVQVRVDAWLNPWKDISGKGYQIAQSLFAIASGGFLGTGIGLGHPEFIPEVQTDFIFSAICEEMGILTGIAVIMLFLILIYRGIKITLEQKNPFFKIIALGITTMFGFQAFIILGGVTKMIPLTGITLPFLSYGGSSLIASFSALGILQVSSEYIPLQKEKEDNNE